MLRIILAFCVLSCVCTALFNKSCAQVSVTWKSEIGNSDLRDRIEAIASEISPASSALKNRRNLRSAKEKLERELASVGYLNPKIETHLTSEENKFGHISIDQGPIFRISKVTISGLEGSVTSELKRELENDAAVLESQPAIASDVISKEISLITRLKAEGFGFAAAEDRSVLGDRDTDTIEVEYNLVTGPRIIFGKVEFRGAKRTKTSYLERLTPFSEGEVYTPEALSLLNTRINETRLFSRSSATLEQLSLNQAEHGNDVILDVIVELDERPRNTLAFGGSLSTSDGAGITSQWTRRNLIRHGDVLEARLTLATLERRLETEWRRPNEFGYGKSLILTAAATEETTDAFDRQALLLGAGYEVVQGAGFSWTYGGTLELVSEDSERIERNLQLAAISTSVRVDRANDLLNPTQGWRAELRLNPHQSFGDSDSSFLRTIGQVRGYYPFSNTLTLAARLRTGAAIGAAIQDLPSDDRFYAGGGGSVRGYGFQAIGPRTTDGEPLGGRALIDGSLELRWQRSTRLGFVGFVDAGSVSLNEQPNLDNTRYGAGLGLRYGTPAGPLRFDVAVPVDKSQFDDPVQFYISIGQAF